MLAHENHSFLFVPEGSWKKSWGGLVSSVRSHCSDKQKTGPPTAYEATLSF